MESFFYGSILYGKLLRKLHRCDALIHHLQHVRHDLRVKLGAGTFLQLCPDDIFRESLSVAAVACHGIIGIGDTDDPSNRSW